MLVGKKIQLRALEPSDIDVLYEWENLAEVWQISNTLAPFSKHTLERYVSSAIDIYTDKQLRLMICENKSLKPIGCIDLFDFDFANARAGIGILIGKEENRKKGYASEALEIMLKYCFNHLHLHQLFCNILENNAASLKLFTKHEFEVTGTKKEWQKVGREWINEYFLQLLKK